MKLDVPCEQLSRTPPILLDSAIQVRCSLRESNTGVVRTAVVEEAIIEDIFDSDSGRSLPPLERIAFVIELSLSSSNLTHDEHEWPRADPG